MTKPKMILFDYGDTLCAESDVDFLRGYEALMPYIKRNKNNLTPQQINNFDQEMYDKIAGDIHDIGYEVHEWPLLRFTYEYLGIELSISIPEAEMILWNAASPGAVMPRADKMLDYINARGIRSGVISNIGWSGAALTERINRFLPRNRFEFILASSEYIFRKPSPMLFNLALRKAGLNASDVWFCGDNIICDVEGAAAVGIFPVWYEELSMENPLRLQNNGAVPKVEHLYIHDWDEMIDALERLE